VKIPSTNKDKGKISQMGIYGNSVGKVTVFTGQLLLFQTEEVAERYSCDSYRSGIFVKIPSTNKDKVRILFLIKTS
jgi:hypothetical protein